MTHDACLRREVLLLHAARHFRGRLLTSSDNPERQGGTFTIVKMKVLRSLSRNAAHPESSRSVETAADAEGRRRRRIRATDDTGDGRSQTHDVHHTSEESHPRVAAGDEHRVPFFVTFGRIDPCFWRKKEKGRVASRDPIERSLRKTFLQLCKTGQTYIYLYMGI